MSYPSDRWLGKRDGLRYAITWLHHRAEAMNDPHARAVLNSAAFDLGNEIREGHFPSVPDTPSPGRAEPPREGGRMADDEQILISAVRYCIGRMSYIVGSCDRWLRERWGRLSEGTRRTILEDIRAALERDRLVHVSIGMDMDRDTWAALYRDLSAPPTVETGAPHER